MPATRQGFSGPPPGGPLPFVGALDEVPGLGHAVRTNRFPSFAMVKLKRAYESPSPADGRRVLVDRLWPRGVTKAQAGLDLWLKDVAPSTALRQWFGHDPAKWDEFRRRYQSELAEPGPAAALAELRRLAAAGPLTLVYSTRETERNHAIVLRDLLLARGA